jgi:hypothetical protein
MDPDVALENMRKVVARIREFLDTEDVTEINLEGYLEDLLLYWDGLDEWLSNGGFLPTSWHANVRHS